MKLRENTPMNRFFIRSLFLCLDPVDINGDEYQNVQISFDNLSISANHPNNNSNTQTPNQSRPDSLVFANDVSTLTL